MSTGHTELPLSILCPAFFFFLAAACLLCFHLNITACFSKTDSKLLEATDHMVAHNTV